MRTSPLYRQLTKDILTVSLTGGISGTFISNLRPLGGTVSAFVGGVVFHTVLFLGRKVCKNLELTTLQLKVYQLANVSLGFLIGSYAAVKTLSLAFTITLSLKGAWLFIALSMISILAKYLMELPVSKKQLKEKSCFRDSYDRNSSVQVSIMPPFAKNDPSLSRARESAIAPPPLSLIPPTLKNREELSTEPETNSKSALISLVLSEVTDQLLLECIKEAIEKKESQLRDQAEIPT